MRTIKAIKRDLRAWLDMYERFKLCGTQDMIELCEREIKAMQDELTFARYGRTDVR